jgi:hypothetical protein
MATSSLLITSNGPEDWAVWISLEDSDPLTDAFWFVIGSGATRDAAVADAVATLEEAVERLQSPHQGVIEERELADA